MACLVLLSCFPWSGALVASENSMRQSASHLAKNNEIAEKGYPCLCYESGIPQVLASPRSNIGLSWKLGLLRLAS